MREVPARSLEKGSTVKGNQGKSLVDQYLAGVPQPARSTLNKVRAVIRASAPSEATETISYGIPTFNHHGPLVAYAAFSKHCSFFPMSGSLLERFQQELKGFSTSKGTIRFPSEKPLPAGLIKKLVKARLAEKRVREKAGAKRA